MLTRIMPTLRMTTKLLKTSPPRFLFSNPPDSDQYRNTSLFDHILNLADNIPDNSATNASDQSELAKKYVDLTEQSFMDFVSKAEANPQMMLMILSTFENEAQVASFLPALYPSINLLEKHEMLLLLEKILAYRPKTKPRIPHPKPLEGIESVLVILSELYPSDSLVEWIKYVPVYQGDSAYVLAMGYFSILEKMSGQIKNRNRSLLVRCHQKLTQTLKDESNIVELRAGIVCLAFEMKYGQAIPLFFQADLDYQKLDPFKLCLLLTSLSKYLAVEAQKQEEVRSLQAEKAARQEISEMLTLLQKIDFTNFMKLDILMDLWAAVSSQKQIKGSYIVLVDKLAKVCLQPDFQKSMKELSAEELLNILECMQKHKINKQKLLKNLLVYFSQSLWKMDKTQLIRLLKCLVTFVRQCENYLIDVMAVLEERKLEFSQADAVRINQILKRVSILFPQPFRVA